MFVGMSALLDFKAFDNSKRDLTIASRQDKCHCDEIYDHYLVSTFIMAFLELSSILLQMRQGLLCYILRRTFLG